MKFNLFFLTIISYIILLASCKDESINVTNTEAFVSENELEMEYLPGVEKDINISTSAQFFRIFSSKDGIGVNTESIIEIRDGKVEKSSYTSINGIYYKIKQLESGYVLSVSTTSENETEEDLTEFYVLKTATSTIPLRITQHCRGNIKKEDFTVYPEGGTFERTVNAEQGKEVEIEKIIGADWLNFEYDINSSKLKFSLDFWKIEDGAEDKKGVIRMKNTSDGTIDLLITQVAPYVKLDRSMVLIQGSHDITKTINIETNMLAGTIALSEKIDDNDPENRISVTPLEYPIENERNASFSVSVNMQNVSEETKFGCKYKIIGIGEAEGLTQIEKTISVDRSLVLFNECFENVGGESFFDYWTMQPEPTGLNLISDKVSFDEPLTYNTSAGEFIMSGVGYSLKKDYFTNRQAINIHSVSQSFDPVLIGENVYLSFLFKLDRVPFSDNKETNYHERSFPIIGLSDGGTTKAGAVWVKKNINETTYSFGLTLSLDRNAGRDFVWSSKKFENAGDVHLIVLKLSLLGKDSELGDRVDLFVDPELNASEPMESLLTLQKKDTYMPEQVSSLFILDNVSNANVQCHIGNISVGKVWDELIKTK